MDILFFFFLSSRRRHPSSYGDWSSDVCSSDLRVLSLERDHGCIADWRRNIADAGLEETAELMEGDARETLPMIDDVFDVVFLDAANKQYEQLFGLARDKLEPGALVIADDVTLHADTLRPYTEARQSDPTLLSTTVPLDRGLELSVVLR